MRTVGATLLLTCALALGACAQNQGGTAGAASTASGAASGSATGQVAAAEPFDEGVDTPCTVSYAPCSEELSPLFLSEGDKIAVIAPSGIPTKEQVDSTIEGLRQWGYEPVASEHVYEQGGTLDDRLEDLVWALEDDSIKAIFCVRGGTGVSEVQDELTLDLISSAHKLIIGYSDISVFHSAWTTAQVPSVHSCMSVTFDGLSAPCVEAEQHILRGEIPAYTCQSDALCQTGTAEGVLVGGNLSTLLAVLGTDYSSMQTDEPYILFIEDVGEDVEHLHRYLTVLKHAGVLDRAAGIVCGEWVDTPAMEGSYNGENRGGHFASVADMISRRFTQDLGIPVAFGFPAGHGENNYPLLMGAKVRLEVSADEYSLSWL